ncbi:putative Uncharacterized protein C9orf85-like protein [Hypsibius exemplaris]|uniref:Uncharacterized protein n=1 Tax=Hypsibius exemplaris TaxID=2072580 RepID=A0A1W0WCI3_HYPEX|nr:putative Uncharacterized protein C9orf85-like protein [Hypsibius exemplaris]
MSSQKGNAKRTRPQKYQNQTVYKKDLYGTTAVTKQLDNIRIEGLCSRCTHIIEWKIKFKKYKKLTAPAICVKCSGRTIKEAYHTLCRPCAADADKCPKCCQPHHSSASSSAETSSRKLPSQSDQTTPMSLPPSKLSEEQLSSSPGKTIPALSSDEEDNSDFSGTDEDSDS